MNSNYGKLLLLVIAAALSLWTWQQYTQARKDLASQKNRMKTCQELADKIHPLVEKKQRLFDETFLPNQVVALMESEGIRFNGRTEARMIVENDKPESPAYRVHRSALPDCQTDLSRLARVMAVVEARWPGVCFSAATMTSLPAEQRNQTGPELWNVSGLQISYIARDDASENGN